MSKSLELSTILLKIVKADLSKDYTWRNRMVYEAMALALEMGYKAGIRFDDAEPHWPVAFIELPEGQVSFHVPQHENEWDGHTTETKYLRILRTLAKTE